MASLVLLGLMSTGLLFAQRASTPWALTSADFDGDGQADLVVVGPGQQAARLFLSGGNSVEIPLDAPAIALATGDMNGDGRADLVIAMPAGVEVLLSNGDGTFREALKYDVGEVPVSLATGDLNGDGRADLVVLGGRSQHVLVLLSNSDGTMGAPTSLAIGQIPTAVAVGDFNGDKRADLVVADAGTNQAFLLLGNGDGSFQSASAYAAGPLPRSLAVGDYNSDGISDLAVASLGDSNVRILLGTTRGALEAAGTYDAGIGWSGMIAADLSGHGKFDLVWANSNTGALSRLSGQGDGTFGSTRELAIAAAAPRTGGSTPTTTSVTVSPTSPATLSQSVTITATVSPSAATGKVTFYDGAMILAIRNVSAGQASLTTTLLAVGVRSLTAVYSGDATYASSKSVAASYTVAAKQTGGLALAAGSPFSSGFNPSFEVLGDFNNDGIADIAVVDSSKVVTILIGNGLGGFTTLGTTIAVGNLPISIATGDFNGDGNADLVVANANDNSLSVALGNGDGTFRTPTIVTGVGTKPSFVVVADFNNDGKADLATTNYGANNVTILLGDGAGNFAIAGTAIPVGSAPIWLGAGDFNGDGIADLAVANVNVNSVSILLGNGSGGFTNAPGSPIAVGNGPNLGVIADLNGDGKLDIAMPNYNSGNVTILQGNGLGGFTATAAPTAGTNPSSVATGDFNGDGKIDLAVANAGSANITILQGDGAGNFTAASASPINAGSNPIAIVSADFNGDGRSDLAAINLLSNNMTVYLGNVALGFFPLTPCRMVDTRNGQNKTGAFGPPDLASFVGRTFPFLQSGCGVPATALAYSTNVTALPVLTLDFLSAWPAGTPYPNVSTLNSPLGLVIANAAILPAGAGGGVTFVAGKETHLIIDENGYFAPPNGSELEFFPLPPCRIADTRPGQGKSGQLGPPNLQGFVGRNFPIANNCGIPSTAQAYSLNFTAVPLGPLQFLSTWPADQSYPNVSTLNSNDGSVIANAALVPAGQGSFAGQITVLAGNPTNVIIDTNGYFAAPAAGGLHFYPVSPCRIADTRPSQPFTGAFGPPALAANVTRDFPIRSSSCNVPSTAQAYSLNMTIVPPGPVGFLSAWPAGQGFPGVSTLNGPDGAVIANAAIVPAGTNGAITVMADKTTDLIIDINGYFAP